MTEHQTHGRAKAGVQLTDDLLDELAEPAGAGLEVAKLRRRPGRPSMGSARRRFDTPRLDPELR